MHVVNNLAGKPVPAQQREEGVDGTLTKKRKLSYSINFMELFEIGNESGRTSLLPTPPPTHRSPLWLHLRAERAQVPTRDQACPWRLVSSRSWLGLNS